uniref:MyoD family inhibitor domain containing 2 n=1 Tax=Oryzias latipes TaxID=8090 RepID=A0A3P9HYA7_ORYLA
MAAKGAKVANLDPTKVLLHLLVGVMLKFTHFDLDLTMEALIKQTQSHLITSEMVSFLNTTAIVRPHMYSFSFVSLISSTDFCFHLLLACLWCQFSVLLLGLLEACSSCLQGLCSSCCHACARCCSAIQDTPVEEFNCHAHCHSVLFESCCEPTECLEFCLECCEICHRS